MDVYAEFVDFISAGVTPEQILNYRASDEMREHFYTLLQKEKAGTATAADKAILDQCMELEHIVRMAKLKARRHVKGE
ncbi:MAG: hypothetical protein H7Z72_01895 [Bacteroidetes bacterium]|nr:hypothetical protein [Fibrella sp.]